MAMALPQATLPSLPQATPKGLPNEILLEIALKSPNAFYAMALAVPFVGRYSLQMQEKLKAHFIVERECILDERDDINGIEYVLPNGWRHSINDKPAVIYEDRRTEWYKNGEKHRKNDLPAIIWQKNGGKEWYKNGQRHRDGDNPAAIFTFRTYWYKNGQLHRDDDMPAVIFANGTMEWYKNGLLHRDGDKPAMIYANGGNSYWRNGVHKRTWAEFFHQWADKFRVESEW